jgi:hypothetical protein
MKLFLVFLIVIMDDNFTSFLCVPFTWNTILVHVLMEELFSVCFIFMKHFLVFLIVIMEDNFTSFVCVPFKWSTILVHV